MRSKRVTGGTTARLFLALLLPVAVLAACAGGATPSSSAQVAGDTLARVKADNAVRIAFANEQPDAYADADGNLIGYGADEARAFFKSIGVTNLEPVLSTYPGMIPGLLANRVDVIDAGFIIRPARCQQVAFGEPDVFLPYALMVQKGNPLNIHTYKDIATNTNAIVGTPTGESTVPLLQAAGIPASRLIQFPDQTSAFTALQGGRINVWAELLNTLTIALEQSKDKTLEVIALDSQPLTADGKTSTSYQALAFRKQDASLVNAWNAWLAKAKTDGELLKIVTKYGLTQAAIAPSSVTAADLCKG